MTRLIGSRMEAVALEGAGFQMVRSFDRSAVPDFGLAGMLPAVMLGWVMVVGGGGVLYPLTETAAQLGLAILLGIYLAASGDGLAANRPQVWFVAILLLTIPVAQLFPLPPSLWGAMPGRHVEVEALSLVGAAQTWRPWSMTPNRTLASLLSLLPPLSMLFIVAGLGARARWRLLATVAGVALAGLLVGVAMRGSPVSLLVTYPYGAAEDVLGFQSSHNGEADVLLMGMLASVAVLVEWFGRPSSRIAPLVQHLLLLAVVCVFTIGVFFTSSRMGIALLVPAVLCVLVMLARRGGGRGRATVPLLVGGIALALVLAGLAVQWNGQVIAIVSRFGMHGEMRPEIWRQSLEVARLYYPFGSGMGSFVPVFMQNETLESVSDTYVIRAHNDYLELLVEAGVAGVLVLGAILAVTGWCMARRWHQRAAAPGVQDICAAGMLLLIALHSLVDYPLRSMSIASIAALALAMLLVPPKAHLSPSD